jgi:hypothetical protein
VDEEKGSKNGIGTARDEKKVTKTAASVAIQKKKRSSDTK